ncbi:MAG TPA: hypothetical protein DD381_14135 [Lentisphaeria bacterium]|nr:MAG: hypothetical protein A2X47_01130 [Lentisphaerae bacterium GWF2_38_69]HBM17463.1 hypothetical protein [Lentisphaeria bacterium]
MLFLVLGIVLFAIFNVLGFLFVRKAGFFIGVERKLDLSKLYSELNKYFVSAIVVYCVLTLFILKKFHLGLIELTFWYLIFSIICVALLLYWLYIEMVRRSYTIQAVRFMILSSAMKNLGFISIIFGIAQYLEKFR